METGGARAQDRLKARLFEAYLSEGEPIGDPETLARLAGEAGLDAGEARAVLDADRYADAVREDERQARRYGISGVPFFVIDGRFGVSGAQPAEALRRALDTAWAEANPAPVLTPAGGGSAEADACTGDACGL